jgi:hypothetical protein
MTRSNELGIPIWLSTSRLAPPTDILRTKQSIPEPSNEIVPALMTFLLLGVSLVVHHNRAMPSVPFLLYTEAMIAARPTAPLSRTSCFTPETRCPMDPPFGRGFFNAGEALNERREMPLHRDIFWLGRQWAVTRFGIRAVNQKLNMQFDVPISRVCEEGLTETMLAGDCFDIVDFAEALSVARKRRRKSRKYFGRSSTGKIDSSR